MVLLKSLIRSILSSCPWFVSAEAFLNSLVQDDWHTCLQ